MCAIHVVNQVPRNKAVETSSRGSGEEQKSEFVKHPKPNLVSIHRIPFFV